MQMWEDLSYQAKEVDASLVSVKRTFTEVKQILFYFKIIIFKFSIL